MSFGILALIVLAGLAGPLLAAGRSAFVPVVVGELAAGVVIGRSGFGWIHPQEPTTAFLAEIGFAMLMFAAGMSVPLRQPGLMSGLRRGGLAAAIAALLAVPFGIVAAHATGVHHPAVYALLLASGSAAILLPALAERGLLDDPRALTVMAQVTIADIAAIVALPLVLQPGHALRAALGGLLVTACVVLLYLVTRLLHGRPWVGAVRRWSKKRGWALDLRLSLLVLFGLVWVAQRSGTSALIAGFGVGLVVAAVGGPKRLSRQVAGVAQGFMVPLFFVVLGARLDLRALWHQPSLIVLAALARGAQRGRAPARRAVHAAAARGGSRRDRAARRSRRRRHAGSGEARPHQRRGLRDRRRGARVARAHRRRRDDAGPASGCGDRRGHVTRGDAAFAELSAEAEAEADEPEAGQHRRAVGLQRHAALVEDVEVADERVEPGAEARRGDHRIRRDPRAVGQQHVGAVEALDAGDDLDRAAPDRGRRCRRRGSASCAS